MQVTLDMVALVGAGTYSVALTRIFVLGEVARICVQLTSFVSAFLVYRIIILMLAMRSGEHSLPKDMNEVGYCGTRHASRRVAAAAKLAPHPASAPYRRAT